MPLRIGGHIVDDPVQLWRRYAWDYPRTIREYDLGGLGDPGVLTAAEAWRNRIINSRPTRHEQDQVVKRGEAALWAGVPADAGLADADPAAPDSLLARAAELYWAFTWPERISGVSVAEVRKILHLKRPGIYPILDNRIKRLYKPSAAAWPGRLQYLRGVAAADSRPYWAAFREDLVGNHDQIEAYRACWPATTMNPSGSWPGSPGCASRTSSRG